MPKHSISRPLCAAAAILASLLLGACTAQTGVADENGILPHLSADLQIPGQLTLHESETFSVVLEQNGKHVDADSIRFEIWPEGRRDRSHTMEGVQTKEGTYSAEYRFEVEGIYVIRGWVKSGALEVMPAKRFAIGEDAVLQLAALEAQEAQSGTSGGGSAGHDHH
ncbi:MAG: hypothetical protein K0Q63_3192 [Paenibacillus sp.]|jgi:hypothetical protein|nr:hypothetical protein [Paenibacillus sp.]